MKLLPICLAIPLPEVTNIKVQNISLHTILQAHVTIYKHMWSISSLPPSSFSSSFLPSSTKQGNQNIKILPLRFRNQQYLLDMNCFVWPRVRNGQITACCLFSLPLPHTPPIYGRDNGQWASKRGWWFFLVYITSTPVLLKSRGGDPGAPA